MAFGNWDDVISAYEMHLNHFGGGGPERIQKYNAHATAMLDLVPKLRDLPEFADVKPGTSLLNLFFQFSEKATKLYVWYEGEGDYRVYLYDPTLRKASKVIDEIVVNEDLLVSTLQEYLNKLRSS